MDQCILAGGILQASTRSKTCHINGRGLGKNIKHIRRIKFNQRNIKYSDVLKYLGVIYDKKYTWINHINCIKGKIYNYFYKLKRICRPSWGIRPSVVKYLYLYVIEKISFACPAWYYDKV